MTEQGKVLVTGATVGVAALGSVGSAAYRNQIADAVPSAVPNGVAQTARESLA